MAHQLLPRWFKISLPLLAFVFMSCACTQATSQQDSLTPAPATPSTLAWYAVYFTEPTDPAATSYGGGIDEDLAAAIDQARVSVDIAVYDLNLWSIRDALIRAHRRGVTVRMVTESDNLDELEVQELKEAGIEVLGDRREGLMHNKFVILDRSEVWTGSMNFTTGGGYLDNNNLIRLRSSKLADSYRHEFEQMFVEDRFGPEKIRNNSAASIKLNNSLIEIYFSPQDGALEHILEAVNSAQESIYFMAYSFTSDELAEAMIQQANAGITVRGIFDQDQYHFNAGTEFDTLLDAGMDVRLDGNPRLMHHKVILVDQQIVITGSYNFSYNAEHNNDENTLIIHNPDIAEEYMAEFQEIYDLSQR